MTERIAIVTGSTSGLGACVARGLLRREWRVVGIGRRGAQFSEPGYEHVVLDLSDAAATSRYFENEFLARHDLSACARIGLVNNAGTIAPVAPLSGASLVALSRSLVLNAAVPAWLMGFLLGHARSAALRIVNISSGAAANAYPGWGAYCLGKAALRMAGQVAAVEADEVPALLGRDLRIVSFAPGVIDTPMQTEVRCCAPESFPRLSRFIALKTEGNLIDPELPAAEICRLLEDDSIPRLSEVRFSPPGS